jgi:hypothetical protein
VYLAPSYVTSYTVVKQVAVTLSTGAKLLEDERLSVTFTGDRASHDPRREEMLVSDSINEGRSEEGILFPSVLTRLKVLDTNGPLKYGVSIDSLSNTVFMVP